MRSLTVCAFVLWIAQPFGCASGHAPSPRLVRVQVEDDRGTPLSGVPIELDGISTTSTGDDGSARVSLSAEGPPRARIGVVCPPDSRPLEARHIARVRSAAVPPLELVFRCRPRLRTLVVVARVRGGEGLVLRADGEAVGTIGQDGTLHAVLSRAPSTDLRLMLDTAERALTPRNPARELRVADRDELLVFDQQLTPIKRRVARATAATAKPPPPLPLPYAIGSNR